MTSSIDLVLLGLVHDQPRSAYDLQKHIEVRHLSEWVKISTPSVYKRVIKLQELGYLDKRILRSGRTPEKTIYAITPKGLRYFDELMDEFSQKPVSVIFDFNAVVAGLNKVSKANALRYVVQIRGSIRESLRTMEATIQEKQAIPLVGQTILIQQKAVLETLERWCGDFEQAVRDAELLEKTKEL